MNYFDYCTGLTMTNARFDELFGGPARKPEQELTRRHMDLAASIQIVLEEIVLDLTRSLRREFGLPKLCLAGGVALNCVANGHILRDRSFDEIWIQPAAGDAGGALGAALAAYYLHLDKPRQPVRQQDSMHGSYLGPEYNQTEIEALLTASGAVFSVLSDEVLLDRVSDALISEQAVGWMQGRMEFGPRALGGRSILADPRSVSMQKTLNLKIKYRESFRPFAPSVRAEDAANWFELEGGSPYMLIVAHIAEKHRIKMTQEQNSLFGIDKLNVPRSSIPAVTHVDYSARIQTVHKETNPKFHALLSRFFDKTGCPILVNTSFNVRGEPIVCTPEDAFRCFMGTQMEVLVVGNCLLYKKDQSPSLQRNYAKTFDLD